MKLPLTSHTRATLLASKWAHKMNLPTGNLWEPPMVRRIVNDWELLGGGEDTWNVVQERYERRLGL